MSRRPQIRRRGRGSHLSLKALFKRDKGRCHLCGQPVRIEDATRDHLIPRSKGGTDGKLNQRLAHRDCNHARGAKDLKPEALKPTGRMRRL